VITALLGSIAAAVLAHSGSTGHGGVSASTLVTVTVIGVLVGVRLLGVTAKFAPNRHRVLFVCAVPVVWIGALLREGATAVLPVWLFLSAVGVTVAVIDVRTKRIPKVITRWAYLGGVPLVVAAGLIEHDPVALRRAALAGVVFFLGYLALSAATHGGMGMGDVRLAGVLGMVLGYAGWRQVYLGALTPFLLAFVVAVLLYRWRGHRAAAFGPYMVAGCAVSLGWLG